MKKLLIALLIMAAAGGGIGYYLWNKPPESMATRQSDMGLTATQLFDAFKTSEADANAKYVGKIIVISGKVKESRVVDGVPKLTLDAGADDATVACELDNNTQHKRTTFNVGDEIKIKGECSGADLDGTVNPAHCAEEQ